MKKRIFRRLGGKRRGFTLIELLIVLSILAVLAAVVVLALTGFIGRGEEAACGSEQAALQTAVYGYYYDNDGAWPTADGNPGAISYALLIGGWIDKTPESDDGGADDCDWEVDEDVVGQVCSKAANCPCLADIPNCAD